MQSAPSYNDAVKYLHACVRHKWLIVIPTVLIGVLATVYSIRLPDVFRSTTLILVTAQKVPEKIVQSTVTTDLQDRLSTISQQILSRTALEKVIQEFGLFAREKKKLAPEEIIDLMRKKITISVDRGARRNEAFEVGYLDSDPKIAQQVTNRLAGLFIEENLKVREQQAEGTSQFLADEIERVRALVQEKEKLVVEFKSKHMNELSGQIASNQARLTQLQNQLQINTQDINGAEDRKLKLQQSLADIERQVQSDFEARKASNGASAKSISDELVERFLAAGGGEGGGSAEPSVQTLEAAVQQQEALLEKLRLTDGERHPEVVKAKNQVQRLRAQLDKERAAQEKKKAEAAKEGRPVAEAAPEVKREVKPVYPPAYGRVKADIATVSADISRLKAQSQGIQKAIEVYQTRIAAVPSRELSMQQIGEDYANLKKTLDSLVEKKLQADLSENMERKQKGEQFRILDPANLPEKPNSPNRLRFVAGGFLGGAALGIGLVLLLDFAHLGVRTREELEAAVALPVLGVIPEIVTEEVLARRRKIRLWGLGAASAALVLASLVVHFVVKPLPQALSEGLEKVRATHWTTAQSREFR